MIVPESTKIVFNFAKNIKKREAINCRKYRRVIIFCGLPFKSNSP
jgi:hypothetical protein